MKKIKILKEIGEYKVGDIVDVNAIDGTINTRTIPKGGKINFNYGYLAINLINAGIAELYE